MDSAEWNPDNRRHADHPADPLSPGRVDTTLIAGRFELQNGENQDYRDKQRGHDHPADPEKEIRLLP